MGSNTTKKVIVLIILLVLVGVLGLFLKQNRKNFLNETSKVDLSQEERKVRVDKVTETAVATKVIDISGCKANPGTAEFKLGETVEFNNNDRIGHTIWFNPEHIYFIPLQSKVKVDLGFYKFPGVRKYMCDSEWAGFVVIK